MSISQVSQPALPARRPRAQPRAATARSELEESSRSGGGQRARALLRPLDQQQVPGAQEIPQPQFIHLLRPFESIQIDVHAGERCRRADRSRPACRWGCGSGRSHAAGAQELHARRWSCPRPDRPRRYRARARPLGARETRAREPPPRLPSPQRREAQVEVGDCHAVSASSGDAGMLAIIGRVSVAFPA